MQLFVYAIHAKQATSFSFMKTLVFLLSFVALFFKAEISKAQTSDSAFLQPYPLKWFVSVSGGVQMSGIKDEDFISTNIAPLVTFSAGKWFTPYLALQIGYRGFYFNTIADDSMHYYGYYFGEVVVKMNQLVKPRLTPRKWSLNLHGGSGCFYNYHYRQPNVCASLGIQNDLAIIKNVSVFLDVSVIIGWDIYQGDEDILPGISLGVNYAL